jgi:hypothetical protein
MYILKLEFQGKEVKMGEKNLKENLEFISENKEHLLKEHKNKFLLVFKKKLVGSYDSYEQAAKEGGAFIWGRCRISCLSFS